LTFIKKEQSTLKYEEYLSIDDGLPLLVSERRRNSCDIGCYFHWHELVEIDFVLSGGIHLLCNGRTKWIHAGEAAFVNWCEPHKSLAFLDGTHHYILQFDLKMLKALHLNYANARFENFPGPDAEIKSIFERIIREFETKERGYQSIVTGDFYYLMGCLERKKLFVYDKRVWENSSIEKVRFILEYIHTHYQKDLTLAVLALETGISESYMCRLFKKMTGTTVMDYTRRLQFAEALDLISQGVRVTEASWQVGIKDYNYFSRLFKKKMGQAPTQYLKSKEKKEEERACRR